MVDVIGRVPSRAYVIVRIELGELDPVRAFENDRYLRHPGSFNAFPLTSND